MAETIKMSLNYIIPDLLADKLYVSNAYQNYNSRGNVTSFGVDLEFPPMQLTKTIKSSDFYLLRGKIENTLRSWEKKYQSLLDKQHKEKRASSVDDMNLEAKNALDMLNGILAHTLNVDDTVNWEDIKRKDTFKIKPELLFKNGKTPNFLKFNDFGLPTSFDSLSVPSKPTIDEIKGERSLFDRLFRKKPLMMNLNIELINGRKRLKRLKKQMSLAKNFTKK